MAESIKKMSVKEFRELGYLQELNRRFLHPLGLALEVEIVSPYQERFGLVWESNDPEGFVYGPGMIDADKAKAIYDRQARIEVMRRKQLGFVIQPTS